MLGSSSALRDGLEVLRVGVLVGLLEGAEWHAGTGYFSVSRPVLTCYRGGPVHGSRCGAHACKQATKALRSQGHPHRTKCPTILASFQQNEGMYTNTSGYVAQWVKPMIGLLAPQGKGSSVPNHIPSLGPTSSLSCRYGGSNTTHGPAQR